MKRNMKQWVADVIAAPGKKALPVLSFPSVQLLGITVRELIGSSDSQAKGMKMIADRVPSLASVSLMDLSVEAEAFGSRIRFTDNEVPTVQGSIVTDEDELITVYYGKDTKEDDAQALTDELASRYGDCDVEMQMGGQPLYYYLVSVE